MNEYMMQLLISMEGGGLKYVSSLNMVEFYLRKSYP